MKKDLTVLLLAASIVCLTITAWADLSLNNSISNDPLNDIMQRINGVACIFFTVITYLASSIAALVIVYAGLKYMSSGGGDTASNAKNMIIYAVIGLALVILACPIVDYLIIDTKIVPFEKTCNCWMGGSVVPGTTTTTIVSYCVDGTPEGQCSVTPAYIGYKCILSPTNAYVLVLDSTCGTPSSSSTTITSTSTTVSTTSSTTTTTLTDQGWCHQAEVDGLCPGLNVLRPNYEQDCCNEWRCCCTPATGTCTAP